MKQTRTQAAEAYLTAVDRLKARVDKLEKLLENEVLENARLREQLDQLQRAREMDYRHAS